MSVPTFFVPAAAPETQETVFTELAQFARRPVPQLSERIYSITFQGDGEEWTATVGESLCGHTVATPQARAKKWRVSRPLSDSATVLAIFAGVPYVVVTDHRLRADVRSVFENPFYAGQPKSVTHFAPG